MLDTTNTYPSIPTAFSPKWDEKAAQYFVDALGVSAWDETYDQTFGYRWRGEDTLTWGNADEWILIKWLLQRFFAQEQLDTSVLAKQELVLRAIIYETRIAKLETIYTFRDSDEVKTFLIDHGRIISILWDARSVIEEFFGEGASVVLDVVSDPEASHSEQLFGYISTGSMSPEEAFERLNAFDGTWFLKQFDLTGGLLNFNLG